MIAGHGGEEEQSAAAAAAKARGSAWPCCDSCGGCTKSDTPQCRCMDAAPGGCHPACRDCVRSALAVHPAVYQCMDRVPNFCQRLFQLDMNRDGEVERSGKAARAATNVGKPARGPLFKLPAGVVPLCNNSSRSDIISMMLEFSTHCLIPNWDEPPEDQV